MRKTINQHFLLTHHRKDFVMEHKGLDKKLAPGSVGELMDKKLQRAFDDVLAQHNDKEVQALLALISKHPQPMTLLWLLLIGYFKLSNRIFAEGGKVDWQDDIAWLKTLIPENNLLHFVLLEITAACYAFNGDFDKASEYYYRVFYKYRMAMQSGSLLDDAKDRMNWLLCLALMIEPENYDMPAIDVHDLHLPEKLRHDYIAETPLFHAYGDKEYIKYYAKIYIEGVKSISPDYFILLTVGNMDDETRILTEELAKNYKNVYFASDDIPEKFMIQYNFATWCACRRFLYVETLLKQLDNPYLIVTDLDLQFVPQYQKLIDYGADADLSYLVNLKETFNPRSTFCANQIYFRKTDYTLEFCSRVSHFIRQKMSDEVVTWYLDQLTLFRVWHQMGVAKNPKCKNISDMGFDGQRLIVDKQDEKFIQLKGRRNTGMNSKDFKIVFDEKNHKPTLFVDPS